jgi:hypothetical protein
MEARTKLLYWDNRNIASAYQQCLIHNFVSWKNTENNHLTNHKPKHIVILHILSGYININITTVEQTTKFWSILCHFCDTDTTIYSTSHLNIYCIKHSLTVKTANVKQVPQYKFIKTTSVPYRNNLISTA